MSQTSADYNIPTVMNVVRQNGNFKFSQKANDQKLQLEKRPFFKIDQDGSHYEGEWIVGTKIREGRGILIWPDGSRYEGYFKQDMC
jgi:hypothetical protein